MVKYLLRNYDIPFEVIGTKADGIISKIGKQLFFANKIRRAIIQHGIDIAMGVSGAAVHGSIKTKAKSILFDDDDQAVQPLMAKFVTPMTNMILSPNVLAHEKLDNAIYYPGYHELAYLHPNRFTADPKVLEKYELDVNERYYILRFNAFKAHHDINEGGMNIEQKRKLVSFLRNYGKVFITSEATLDQEFEPYKMPISPEDMHHFLAFAQMLVSDSQTMTSEAAILGTPSFRCNSFVGRISYLEEEEKRYKLTKAFLPRQFDWMLESIKQHLQMTDLKEEWSRRRARLLEDKIDVTAFWVWFVENYPRSRDQMRKRGFSFEQFR